MSKRRVSVTVRKAFVFIGAHTTLFVAVQSAYSASPETPEPQKGAISGNLNNLQGQKPNASFLKLRHDFGEIVRGEKVAFAFEFKNTGSGVLQIRSIHSSCGCVNTRVEPSDVFAPGESGRLTFEFDSSFFSGNVVRTLTVDTNQARNSAITLTFTAAIREEIRSTPALLDVGEVLPEYNKVWLMNLPTALRAAGQGSEALPLGAEQAGVPSSIQKQLVDSEDVRPLYATSSHPAILAEVVEPSQKEKDYLLKVSFKGPLPIGPLREKISVWNTSRHLKELIVPIIGEVVGHVKQSAKYVEFGVVSKAQEVKRTLSFTSDRPDFKVESVTAELRRTDALEGVSIADILKYSTVLASNSTLVNFELRFPERLKNIQQPVNASGLFIVKTNDPDYGEVRVPFFGVLRQGDEQ
jgi:hypothetical protein